MRSGRAARTLAMVALGAAIGAVAFVPRARALDRGFTIDERLWIDRSDRFVDHVVHARFGETVETGHPGVVTMWVGGLAQRTLPDGAGLRARYARARLWLAVVAAGLVVVAWLLSRRVLGEAAAAIAGLLLALDPFLLANGRVLHLDGILSLAMLASFLALMGSVRASRPRLIEISGALAGLALLTKAAAAIYLVPATLVVLWRGGGGILRPLVRWGLAALVISVALWPALWVRPWHAIAEMLGGGGSALAETTAGGFFLGRRVSQPGPLYYPVALALRTSAWTLPAGIAAAVWALRRRRVDGEARTALALLAFGLGLVLLITPPAKKSDRYALPAIVALDVAVAVGMARALRGRTPTLAGAVLAGALAAHAAPALAASPYENASYNWLAGGPPAAQRAIVVGWGQGLDEAAARLNALPYADSLVVATTYRTNFADFFAGTTELLGRESLRPDYVLFYISTVQTGTFEREWRRYRDRSPALQVEVNGMPFVRVYEALP